MDSKSVAWPKWMLWPQFVLVPNVTLLLTCCVILNRMLHLLTVGPVCSRCNECTSVYLYLLYSSLLGAEQSQIATRTIILQSEGKEIDLYKYWGQIKVYGITHHYLLCGRETCYQVEIQLHEDTSKTQCTTIGHVRIYGSGTKETVAMRNGRCNCQQTTKLSLGFWKAAMYATYWRAWSFW